MARKGVDARAQRCVVLEYGTHLRNGPRTLRIDLFDFRGLNPQQRQNNANFRNNPIRKAATVEVVRGVDYID